MTLYAETIYYCNLGEPIEIIPTTTKNVSFITCKYLPSGLLFNKRDGIVSGIYEKENYLELQIKYKKNNAKIISETVKVSIKKREPVHKPDLSINLEHIIEKNENEPITYYLSENDNEIEHDNVIVQHQSFQEIPVSVPCNLEETYNNSDKPIPKIINKCNIEEKIKKSIHDLSLSKAIKFMCINESN